ncbi:MAG: hypothetical protein AAGF12_25625 [Myxococcota bacterium]
MGLYGLSMIAHSYLRWAVLLGGAIVIGASSHGLLRRRDWTALDERSAVGFVLLVDIQFVLGLLLFVWLSPITHALFTEGFDNVFQAPGLWFFGLAHPGLMVAAFVVMHFGRAKAKRLGSAKAKFRLTLVSAVVWFGLVVLAIPWPFLAYGRPLVRLFS